jgi:hypothetical protein
MFMSSKLVRLALFALPLLASTAPAVANVRSANSSTVCQWEEEETRRGFHIGTDEEGKPQIFSRLTSRYSPQKGMYHTGGYDDGPAFNAVTCNIPRNLPLRTDGMSDLEVRFSAVTARTGTFGVTCTAYSYRSDGTLAGAATRTTRVDMTGTGTVPLDFGAAISASAPKGYYILTCDMPSDVALHSIYSSENDGVSNN